MRTYPVLWVGAAAVVVQVGLKMLSRVTYLPRANFILGLSILVLFILGGYCGAGDGSTRAGARGGATVGLMLAVIGFPLLAILSIVGGYDAPAALVIVGDALLLPAVGALFGTLGAALRRLQMRHIAA